MPNYNQAIADRSRTKIVATLGPASKSPEMIGQLIAAGVDVFRLNMAHGDLQQHESNLKNIRLIEAQQDRPIAVLADLSGPKIRIGQLMSDPLECGADQEFEFVRDGQATSPRQLTTNYERLIDELEEGDRVLLADGTVAMRVIEKSLDRVKCKVTTPGELRSRQGVNLPGVKLSVPAITEQDRTNTVWASKNQIDFVSLSFVRTPAEVRELREMLRELGSLALVIAKIEKPEALECLDEIVLAADGVMVARGDLGVEIDVAETPVAQKRIINACSKYRRPVIVATQMLDSMQQSSRPTRAEVSDVANAILDGADACMLSGETAIGKYPLESVQMMNRIMISTERMLSQQAPKPIPADTAGVHRVTESIVYGAGKIAERLSAKMVVIATHSGRTALAKSKQRDFITSLGVSDREETLRQMALYWGIEPVRGAPQGISELREFIDRWASQNEVLEPGDLTVLLAGSGFRSDAHNEVVVHEVS